MKIKFLGAAQTVTGSMHYLQINGSNILLDCGLFQGRRRESFERNRNLPFDASQVDAMLLSHAHIDHSGNIPSLVRGGSRGNIYATFATRDLCSAMLRDSAHIQEADVKYVNKRRLKKGLLPIEPLYTKADAVESLKYFVGMGYDRWFTVTPGVRAIFYDAGHILGSAIIVLDITENGRSYRLAFTGDLGRVDLPILKDPTLIHDVDYLITESTYGNREHETPYEAEEALQRVVTQTYKRRGKVIIPAFAVGRTQEVVYALHRLTLAGKIPEVDIFVDSPLAVNVTEIFRLHPESYDEETLQFMLDHPDPFGFTRLRYVRQVEESKKLNFLKEPAVIISASGMCEAGRILHHLKNNIEDARNTVLIVGFQAEHTLGRRIVERNPEVRIFGDEYKLRAKVEIINGYSAHADRSELLSWIKSACEGGRLQKVFVVHGDPPKSRALAEGIRELGVPDVLVPARQQGVEF